MKYVLLRKIVIVVGKLTRSGVLWGGEGRGFAGASRDGDGARKFFPPCRAVWGSEKTKLCGGGDEKPILFLRLASLPSLLVKQSEFNNLTIWL